MVRIGRCSACTSAYERRRREAGAKALYATPEWKAVRRRMLGKQRICECGARTTEVDHRIAVKDGGAPLDEENLEARCKPCHSRKTALLDGRWG